MIKARQLINLFSKVYKETTLVLCRRLLITALLSLFFFVATFGFVYSSDFKELRSAHFIVKYQGRNEQYAYRAKEKAEDLYVKITQEFHLIRDKLWLWDNRAKLFIFKDKDAYKENTTCPSWSRACVNYRDKIIYTYPYQRGFFSTLAHELTHIIFREYVGERRLPLWLDEGMAVYIENKYGNGIYSKRLSFLKRKIKEGKYIKFSELKGTTPESLKNKPGDYVEMFYLESFSIVNYLMKKYGRGSSSIFLYSLRYGDDLEEALSKSFVYYSKWDVFQNQWLKFYLR